MDNEEFKNLVISQLNELNSGQGNLIKRLDSVDEQFESIDKRLDSMDDRFDLIDERQEEIYQVVRSIEHSNKVGKAELDNNNIRISK